MWAGTNVNQRPVSDSIFSDQGSIPRLSPTPKRPLSPPQDPGNLTSSNADMINYFNLNNSRRNLPRPRSRSRNGLRSASGLPKVANNCITSKNIIDLTLSSEEEQKVNISDDESSAQESPSRSSTKSAKKMYKRAKTARSSSQKTNDNNVVDIASSPIKELRPTHTPSPTKLSSSPIRKKKSVVFSDFLVSDAPSSPAPNQTILVNDTLTPRKSILKPNIFGKNSSSSDPNNTALWVKSSYTLENEQHNSPSNPKFWLPGTIIQLTPDSPDLPQLVDGCLNVLKDSAFNKKFEVYATLNHICKFNSTDVLMKLFITMKKAPTIDNNNIGNSPLAAPTRSKSPSSLDDNYISEFSGYIKRDIQLIEDKLFNKILNLGDTKDNLQSDHNVSPRKNDPFSIRIISQALRFMFLIISNSELNNFLSVNDVKWFYMHSCQTIIKPEISKTLLLPYLSIIKDCKFTGRKKKLIFELQGNSSVLEHMLFALLNMKNFTSSSLVVEKFITLRNLVLNFPVVMAQNFHHWFSLLVINLCDSSSPLYSKVITMGVSALLEVARTYLENRDILVSVRKFMESPLPSEIKSFSSDAKISVSNFDLNHPTPSGLEYISNCLLSLIDNGQYKPAMDIWVSLTLLCNDSSDGFENWSKLSSWLQIHKSCFNKPDSSARIIAITSWKAIVYNLCSNDFNNLRKSIEPMAPNSPKSGVNSPMTPRNKSNQQQVFNSLRPKVKLLLHILLNISSPENEREIIDVLNNLFLSMVYMLLNPLNMRDSLKYTHVYWDKVIQPTLIGFHFKKDASSHMNQLGLKFLTRLLSGGTPITERNFNEIRCLSIEPLSLLELNGLNPKWVHNRFDRILQTIALVFKLDKVNVEAKANYFIAFLNNLKLSTKKEIKTSEATFDIIDDLTYVLGIFFKHNKISYTLVLRLLSALKDTFTGYNLMQTTDPHQNVFILILRNTIDDLNSMQLTDMITSVCSSIGDKMQLQFTYQLLNLNINLKKPELQKFATDILVNVRANITDNSELEVTSKVLNILDQDFHIFAKRLIQDMVLVRQEEFQRLISILKVHNWSLPIFKFFINLIHDAPLAHLKQMGLNLIILKWEQESCFIELLKFLTDNDFHLEIFNLKKNLLKKASTLDEYAKLDFEKIWSSYLNKTESGGNFVLYDQLLLTTYEGGFEVEKYVNGNWDRLPLLKAAYTEKKKIEHEPSCEALDQFPETSIKEPESESSKEQQGETKPTSTLEKGSFSSSLNKNNIHDELPNQNSARSSRSPTPKTSTENKVPTVKVEETGQNSLVFDQNDSLNPDELKNSEGENQSGCGEASVTTSLPQGEVIPDLLSDSVNNEEANSRESSVPLEKTGTKSKKSSKSPGAKSKKKSKKQKENKMEPQSSPDNSQEMFDIHSFTALLTQKLTPAPTEGMTKAAKRKARRSRLHAQKRAAELARLELEKIKASGKKIKEVENMSESEKLPDKSSNEEDLISDIDSNSFNEISSSNEMESIDDSAIPLEDKTMTAEKCKEVGRQTRSTLKRKSISQEPVGSKRPKALSNNIETSTRSSDKQVPESEEESLEKQTPQVQPQDKESLIHNSESRDKCIKLEEKAVHCSLQSDNTQLNSFNSQSFQAHSTTIKSLEKGNSAKNSEEDQYKIVVRPSLPVVQENPQSISTNLLQRADSSESFLSNRVQGTFQYLSGVIGDISQEAINSMNPEEKHRLETEMIKLMLRLRTPTGTQRQLSQ